MQQPNMMSEESQKKRQKLNIQQHKLNIKDVSIVLDHRIQKWIECVGLDVDAYQRALYKIHTNNWARYFRYRDPATIKTDEYELLDWIRSVDIYKLTPGLRLPSQAVGIDAASASVVDALRLGPLANSKDDKLILDMCCAPGGKLLTIVSAIRNFMDGPGGRWRIVGLDSSKRRLDVCRSLLKKENVNKDLVKVKLINCKAQEFKSDAFGLFDRILLDAECTHEGSLRSVSRTLKFWGENELIQRFTDEHLTAIIENQREMLRAAIKLLKPMGILIFSTCSMHKRQNHLLVAEIVSEYKSVKLHPLPINYCDCCRYLNDRECLKRGTWPIDSLGEQLKAICDPSAFHKASENCKNVNSPVAVRFNPLSLLTDGLFLACLIKTL